VEKMMPERDLDIAARFAGALDAEDHEAAARLLDPRCEYEIRGERLRGPSAIIASYSGNAAAARAFDAIEYSSGVRLEGAWVVIRFIDRIRHGGRSHEYACEQWLRVAEGLITRIEHRELPGRREALDAFKRDCLG
jgi:hypothetical protein